MAEERDVLFRLGFTQHPQANAELKKLTDGVKNTQSELAKSVKATGSDIGSTMPQIEQMMQGLTRQIEKLASSRRKLVGAGSGTGPARVASGMRGEDFSGARKELAKFGVDADKVLSGNFREIGRLANLVEEQFRNINTSITKDLGPGVSKVVAEIRKEISSLYEPESDEAFQASISRVTDFGNKMIGAYQKIADDRAKTAREQAEAEKSQHEAEKARIKEQERLVRQQLAGHERVRRIREAVERESQKQADVEKQRQNEKRASEKKATDAVMQRSRMVIAAEQRVSAMRERSHRETLASLNQQRQEAISGYRDRLSAAEQSFQQESVAAREAYSRMEQGQNQLRQSVSSAATGFGQLARSAVLLGFAEGDAADKALQKLAKVQAMIDAVRGASNVFRSVTGAMDGLRKMVTANVQARDAQRRAAKAAADMEERLAQAQNATAISAERAANQARKLNIERNQTAASARRAGVSGRGRGRSRGLAGGFMSMGAGPIAGMTGIDPTLLADLSDALRGNMRATRENARALRFMRNASGAVSRVASRIPGAQAFGGMLTRLGTLGTRAFGMVTASSVALAGAAAAAVGGLAFAGKSVWEFAKAIKNGGTEVGSWSDVIASGWAKFGDAIGRWIFGLDMLGNTAVAEAEARMKFMTREEAIKEQHQNEIIAIELSAARKRLDIQNDTRKELARLDRDSILTGNDTTDRGLKQANIQSEIRRLQAEQQKASVLGASKIQELQDSQERLILEIAKADGAGRNKTEAEKAAREEKVRALESTSSNLDNVRTGGVQQQIALLNDMKEMRQAAIQLQLEENAAQKSLTMEIGRSVTARESELQKMAEGIATEHKAIDDLIKKKRDAHQSEIANIEQRFAMMSKGDQKQTVRALERARLGEKLNQKQAGLLQSIGTDESERLFAKWAKGVSRDAGVGIITRDMDAKAVKMSTKNGAISELDAAETERYGKILESESRIMELRKLQSQEQIKLAKMTHQSLEEIQKRTVEAVARVNTEFKVVNEQEITIQIAEASRAFMEEQRAMIKRIILEQDAIKQRESEEELRSQRSRQDRQTQARIASVRASG